MEIYIHIYINKTVLDFKVKITVKFRNYDKNLPWRLWRSREAGKLLHSAKNFQYLNLLFGYLEENSLLKIGRRKFQINPFLGPLSYSKISNYILTLSSCVHFVLLFCVIEVITSALNTPCISIFSISSLSFHTLGTEGLYGRM